MICIVVTLSNKYENSERSDWMSFFKYNNNLDFLWDTVGIELKDVSHDKIKLIMNEYYCNEITVEKIVKKFNLNFSANKLNLNFPKIKSNQTCEYDGTSLQFSMPSRTALLSPYCDLNLTCPFCKHSPTNSFCNCINCKNQREENRKKRIENQEKDALIKRSKIVEIYSPEANAKINTLTLRDKIYFAALMRTLASEDILKIMPYESRQENMTPFIEKDMKIINYFCNNSYIKVDVLNSNINYFNISDEKDVSYYPNKVIYELNFNEELSTKDLYKALRHPESKDFFYNKEKTLDLWREFALDECIAFLNYQFKNFNFPKFNVGEKTIDTFTTLLNKFSTGKIFNLIYLGVKNAAAYQRRDGITVKRAQNSAITNISYFAARALDENWSLKNYDVPYKMVSGCMTDILYDEILGLGSAGHKEVPTVSALKNLQD